MSSGVSRMAVGSFYGTAAELTVDTMDFKPRYVRLLNVTGKCIGEWLEGMADDSVNKIVDSGSGTTDISLATSGGITPANDGFVLGADTDLNVAAELVRFVAFE